MHFTLKSLFQVEVLSKREEDEYIAKAQEGCDTSRDILIKSNMGFIMSVCQKYANDKIIPEELISYGVEGVCQAIDSYKNQGHRFLTYMKYRVRGCIYKSAFLEGLVRIPERTYWYLRKISAVLEEFGDLSDVELVIHTGLSNKVVAKYRPHIDLLENISSLDYTFDDSDTSLLDLIADERRDIERMMMQTELSYFLSKLDITARYILTRCYGVPVRKSLTELSKELGITLMEVKWVRDEALKYLQQIAAEMYS